MGKYRKKVFWPASISQHNLVIDMFGGKTGKSRFAPFIVVPDNANPWVVSRPRFSNQRIAAKLSTELATFSIGGIEVNGHKGEVPGA
jgi:hypothetical protein